MLFTSPLNLPPPSCGLLVSYCKRVWPPTDKNLFNFLMMDQLKVRSYLESSPCCCCYAPGAASKFPFDISSCLISCKFDTKCIIVKACSSAAIKEHKRILSLFWLQKRAQETQINLYINVHYR